MYAVVAVYHKPIIDGNQLSTLDLLQELIDDIFMVRPLH
jgi:hypothetical protein